MKNAWLQIPILALVLNLTVSVAQNPPSPGVGTIQGIVTRAGTTEPLTAVQVTLQGGNADPWIGDSKAGGAMHTIPQCRIWCFMLVSFCGRPELRVLVRDDLHTGLAQRVVRPRALQMPVGIEKRVVPLWAKPGEVLSASDSPAAPPRIARQTSRRFDRSPLSPIPNG
jgi:hypothetical protein